MAAQQPLSQIKIMIKQIAQRAFASRVSWQYYLAFRFFKPPLEKKPMALIVHLFYPEMWTEYEPYIERLKQATKLDIYVTIPSFKRSEVTAPIGDYVFFVPNRGRDVLPFLQVIKHIKLENYECVLKLHSKKSPQRENGSNWNKQLLAKLIPQTETLNQLLKSAGNQKVGLVGPSDNYVPLSLYYDDNAAAIKQAVTRIFDHDTAQQLVTAVDEFGFFAGTMFWMSRAVLTPIKAAKLRCYMFEPENGQLDGTFAHAMERVFSLVAEIQAQDMFQSAPDEMIKIPYTSVVSTAEWDKQANNKQAWQRESS